MHIYIYGAKHSDHMKFKFCQYQMRAVSPNLMLTKVTVLICCHTLYKIPIQYCLTIHVYTWEEIEWLTWLGTADRVHEVVRSALAVGRPTLPPQWCWTGGHPIWPSGLTSAWSISQHSPSVCRGRRAYAGTAPTHGAPWSTSCSAVDTKIMVNLLIKDIPVQGLFQGARGCFRPLLGLFCLPPWQLAFPIFNYYGVASLGFVFVPFLKLAAIRSPTLERNPEINPARPCNMSPTIL